MPNTDTVIVTTVVAVVPVRASSVFTEGVDVRWCCGPRFLWAAGYDGEKRFEPAPRVR